MELQSGSDFWEGRCNRVDVARQMSEKKDRKPAKASGPQEVEGSGGGLLGGEIAARETDESEDTGAEERQREWFGNSGRCD